jgi:hypothetical protein
VYITIIIIHTSRIARTVTVIAVTKILTLAMMRLGRTPVKMIPCLRRSVGYYFVVPQRNFLFVLLWWKRSRRDVTKGAYIEATASL